MIYKTSLKLIDMKTEMKHIWTWILIQQIVQLGIKCSLRYQTLWMRDSLDNIWRDINYSPNIMCSNLSFIKICKELLKQPKYLKLLNKLHKTCMFNYKIAKISKKFSEQKKTQNYTTYNICSKYTTTNPSLSHGVFLYFGAKGDQNGAF